MVGEEDEAGGEEVRKEEICLETILVMEKHQQVILGGMEQISCPESWPGVTELSALSGWVLIENMGELASEKEEKVMMGDWIWREGEDSTVDAGDWVEDSEWKGEEEEVALIWK